MKLRSEQLARRLASALGADGVTADAESLGAHLVDGERPALICSPQTPEQVAAALRVCSDARAAMIPWGGGTCMSLGNPPHEPCVILKLTRMNRVIEHDHANLTATMECGITPHALAAVLFDRRQFLPFDPPHPAQATIGGIVAANLNGPRRGFYGSIRDLVIGMRVALVTGEQIKAGGKVVKNVAGYDLCKLFTGALGTLGVITEVTVRVAPIPESAAALMATGMLLGTLRFIQALARSSLLPAAVTLTNIQAQSGAEKHWQAAIWCEGYEASVARHLSDAAQMARQAGLATTTLRGTAHRESWDQFLAFPLTAERCVYRATLPRAAVGKFLDEVGQTTATFPLVASDVVTGTVWLSWPADGQAGGLWPQLMALATAHRGHATLFSAPHRLKKGLDVWGPPPSSFSLMQKIKRQFDPNSLLNPGRFTAGL